MHENDVQPEVPDLNEKFNPAAFKYFIQPPSESKRTSFSPAFVHPLLEFINQTFEKLIMPCELTLCSVLQFRYTLETFTDAQMQLYYKYLSLEPFYDPHKIDVKKDGKKKEKEPKVYLCLDNLYFKQVTGEDPKMVLFTDGMLIEFKFSEELELKKWMNELTKYCVKMSLSNDYKILDLIGKGGFSTVYKARRLEEFKKPSETELKPPPLQGDSAEKSNKEKV